MTVSYPAISKKATQIITAERPEDREQAAYLMARYALMTIWHKDPEQAVSRTRALLAEFSAMASQ